MVATAQASTRRSGPWCARARRSTATSSSDSLMGGAGSWSVAPRRSTCTSCAGASRGRHRAGTPRSNPYKVDGGVDAVKETLRAERIDALVAIGGEEHPRRRQQAFRRGRPRRWRAEDDRQRSVGHGGDVRVPHRGASTRPTRYDRLHTTAESHDRVMVCEVMGRHAGWIATYSGIAAGACRPHSRRAV